jgi:hypothetical protein
MTTVGVVGDEGGGSAADSDTICCSDADEMMDLAISSGGRGGGADLLVVQLRFMTWSTGLTASPPDCTLTLKTEKSALTART